MKSILICFLSVFPLMAYSKSPEACKNMQFMMSDSGSKSTAILNAWTKCQDGKTVSDIKGCMNAQVQNAQETAIHATKDYQKNCQTQAGSSAGTTSGTP